MGSVEHVDSLLPSLPSTRSTRRDGEVDPEVLFTSHPLADPTGARSSAWVTSHHIQSDPIRPRYASVHQLHPRPARAVNDNMDDAGEL